MLNPPLSQSASPNRWWIWVSVAIGVFMATLDSSIINVSLPTIAHSLHTSLPATQWIVLAYMIGLSGLLIPAGRLSDIIGRRKVFVWGMLIFTLGSFFCGLAHSVTMLIVMRLVQAIGAAGLLSSGPAITTETFSHDRGKALGLIGMVVSLGSMAGPSLGGWIVEALGWPWIFWVNLPVGIVSSIYAWKMLSVFDTPHYEPKPFDFEGAFLSITVLSTLTLLLTYGLSLPIHHPANLALGSILIITLIAFIYREASVQNPLVGFSMFQERLFTKSCVSSFLSFIGITAISFLVPFYLQVIRHFSPAQSGWILITMAVSLSIFSPISGTLSDRFGPQKLTMLGMLISAGGLAFIASFSSDTGTSWIVTGLFLVGMGNGLFHAPNSSQLLGSASFNNLGLASAMLAIVRTLGMASAIALVGYIYTRLHAQLGQAEGFMPAFKMVFTVGVLACLANILWIGWYRSRS